MKLYAKQFLGVEEKFFNYPTSAAVLLPFPYEGGVSYGSGTAAAPEAVIDASYYLELYDEVFDCEPFRMGIATLAPPSTMASPEEMNSAIRKAAREVIKDGKFLVVLGGDHSISSGYFQELQSVYPDLGAIQIDAHADLRDSYEGSKLSHASVMARIRELTSQTLQLGIRSMSGREAKRVKEEKINLCTMVAMRRAGFSIDRQLQMLPEHVFLTFDVDALDWSVVSGTGTPEPGGFTWDEIMTLLEKIFFAKNVVGCDVVELSHNENDPNSPFAVAKLLYKIFTLKFLSHNAHQPVDLEKLPAGSIFLLENQVCSD